MFCIYVQYIQVYNTYKIRYYLHTHTHTHTSLLSFELIKHTPTSELLYLQYFTSFRSLPKYHFPRGSFSPHHSLILILLYFSSQFDNTIRHRKSLVCSDVPTRMSLSFIHRCIPSDHNSARHQDYLLFLKYQSWKNEQSKLSQSILQHYH